MCSRRWPIILALPAVLVSTPLPAHTETDFLIGAGPDIGFWDVADGHHVVGLNTRVMYQPGADQGKSFRFDIAYTLFWAEGPNDDYGELAFLANWIVPLSRQSRPYWTVGGGFDRNTDVDGGSLIFGTGVGVRLGWGNIEARFDLADTGAGLAAHVPVFAALRF